MKPIETVAIIGAGNMGSGIAQKTAQEQFPVQMVDREQQWVERGQETIAKLLGEAVERRIFSEGQVEEIQGRITGVVGVENVAADTDLVIEAVFEDFDVKTAVFNTLDEACGDATILASNTSSLSVNATQDRSSGHSILSASNPYSVNASSLDDVVNVSNIFPIPAADVPFKIKGLKESKEPVVLNTTLPPLKEFGLT